MKFKNLTAPILAAYIAVAAGSAAAADLTVTVDGMAGAQGNLMVALFDKASEFPSGNRLKVQMVPAAAGTVRLVFTDIPPGRYALSAFHDVNGNGRLDANMGGLPTEPYGASRDARGKMGPPAFDDAAVTLAAQPLSLTIHLH